MTNTSVSRRMSKTIFFSAENKIDFFTNPAPYHAFLQDFAQINVSLFPIFHHPKIPTTNFLDIFTIQNILCFMYDQMSVSILWIEFNKH